MNTSTKLRCAFSSRPKAGSKAKRCANSMPPAKLDGVRLAVGFPDLHPGKARPVGAAFVTEGVIYPHLIGGDIGCGMALFKTDLVRREAKLERWASCGSISNIRGTNSSADFLAEHDLESTEFDSALGTHRRRQPLR